MRFARVILGLLLALTGLVAAAAGAVAAFWLVGPDNTISTPSREFDSTGLAVVTAPSLLDRHGPTLRVNASGDKPLFVGVAQDLDVRDYLSGAAHTRLVRFDPPATFGTQDLKGSTSKLTPPGELDWWVAHSAPGSQSLSWPIQDGRYDVVVMNADGTPSVGAQVTFGVQVPRLFGICLLVFGAGVLVLALGLALMLRRRPVAEQAPEKLSDTTEIPVITNKRIPVLVSTAPTPEQNAPAHRVSPFAPDRVSPFAPDRVSPFAPKPTQPAATGELPAAQSATQSTAQSTAQSAAQSAAHPAAQSAAQPAAQSERPAAEELPAQPEPTNPVPTQPTPDQPAATRPAAAQPEPALPGTTHPSTTQPSTTQPSTAQPGTARPAPVWSAPPRTAPVAVPAAPMFMSPAAVARAKSPVLIGAGASHRHDEPARPAYDEPAASTTSATGSATTAAAAGATTTPAPATTGTTAESGDGETVPLAASPEFVKSDEAVRRTAALLASGALLLTATSCGLVPPKNTLAAADTRPAVTLADAQAVVQRYNEINNRANQTRDDKLARTIEGNPTLAQTQAGFVIGRKLDAAGKEVSKPFSYTDPEIGAPQFSAYPMRFVVSSGVSDAPGSRQLGVWQRESAGSPWLLTHSVYPSKSVEPPSVDGLRTPSTADLNRLQAQPAAVAKDLAAYLTGGAKSPQASRFKPSPGLAKLLELRAKSKAADTAEPYIASVTDTFTPSGTPLTFITSSGDALVFLSLTEQYLQHVEPGSNAYWTSGEATAFSNMVKYTRSLYQNYLHQVALVIPAQSSGATVQILSVDPQLVGAGGD